MDEALFFLAAFVAEVGGTIAGFGSSTIFMPVALFFLDFKAAIVLVAFFHISGNIGRINFFRAGIDKRLILLFGLPSVLLTVLGASFIYLVSQSALKLILGAFLLIFSVSSILKPDLRFPANEKSAVAGGCLSGFFAGLIGTGGALRGAFLTAFNLEKTKYIATSASIALAVDITRIPIYLAGGFIDARYYFYVPVLFVTAIAGSYTGRKIVSKIPQSSFRIFVLITIALVSLKFIYDGITGAY